MAISDKGTKSIENPIVQWIFASGKSNLGWAWRGGAKSIALITVSPTDLPKNGIKEIEFTPMGNFHHNNSVYVPN